MWRRLSLVIFCCAVSALDALDALESVRSAETLLGKPKGAAEPGKPTREAPPAATVEDSLRGREQQSPGREEERAPQPTAEPLEDELDNQENIISQLLGDYDKVKTVSSGSDCVCRCVVRPIKRSDCSRIHDSDPASLSQDHYTVETITKGTDCQQCVCMAPPSAVNPCEGEYRFKKLQEASRDDIKLATIIDLLEGSLYGLDLLKLNSVTTKLLRRVDNMEKAFARNFTERAREKERVKERAKEKEKEKKAQQKKKKVNDLERAGQKSGAGAFANKQKNYEGQLKKNQQQDGLEQQQPTRNKTKTSREKTEAKQPVKVVRGVTFYKAEQQESFREEEEEEEERVRGRYTTIANTDALIWDQKPPTRTSPTRTLRPPTTVSLLDESRLVLSSVSPTQPPTAPPTTTQQTTTTSTAAPTTMVPTTELTTILPTTGPTTVVPTTTTTPKPTTTKLNPTTSQQTTIQPTRPANQQTTISDNKAPPTDASLRAQPPPRPKSGLSWTESPADQPKTTKKPAVCKDTVASLSEPVEQNSYGLSEGAWMRDARGHGNVVYVTNGHYGNNLLEFRDMDTFKTGQTSNSYKLPYSFTGTGHVVFNGAFYYNRAFSRDIIRYDLRHRYVAAWTTLHDALLEEHVHRTQTEVEFAVDESGLWLLYPALDTEGFHQEVMLLIHLRPRDLQPIQTFRTGLRRGRYGNSFLVCGVLYGVNSMQHRYANVTYAFDTHTLTHTVPSLAFTNMHAQTSQLAYCPLGKKLYAWDAGHQMTYDVIFAY
ncbi:olfactomedin-like protein 2B [Centropristis striata]|uniref:olfactomedin-like protein 2B n=1 Tax=Centropristis striata TaxID=184440 RepID=UPI0027E0CEA7|nr:olfactomedin-like protein 2B [Centropristis striata]